MSGEEITEYLNELGEKFSEITLLRKRVKIKYSDRINELADELKNVGYISSKSIEDKEGKKYVQFNTKNKE